MDISRPGSGLSIFFRPKVAFYQGFVGMTGVEPATSALSVRNRGLVRQIGIRYDLPVRATPCHQKTGRATSFGHALGTGPSARSWSAHPNPLRAEKETPWGSRLLSAGFAPAACRVEDVRPVLARASSCMLICMQTTSVRIDGETHEELKRLADELGTTVGRTVTLAVRALRQDRVGKQLAQPLRADETAWLDAELG